MPITFNAPENGLGWLTTCDCADFLYRQEKNREMTQGQINSRELKGFNALRVTRYTPLGLFNPPVVYEAIVEGGSEPHKVTVSKGSGDAGPNFLCAHCFCALEALLDIVDQLSIITFKRKDAPDPLKMNAAGWERLSLDGWMDVVVRRLD